MLLCSCPQGYRKIGPTCTMQTTPQALGRQWALAVWPSPHPAACCGHGPIRGRLWDDSAGIQGKEPRAAAS